MSIQPGTYRIRNVKSGTYLDASARNEGVIHGWASRENDDQKWIVERSGGGYTLKNVANGRYASVNDAQDNNPVQATGNPTEWNIENKGDGSAIYACGSGVVIDLDSGRSENGTAINVWGWHGAKQQLWCFEQVGQGGGGYGQQQQQQQQSGGYQGPVTPGAYHIVNAFTGTVFDLAAGDANDGTPISGWERGNGPNQIWHVEAGQNGYRFRNHASNTYASFGGNVQEGALLTGKREFDEWVLKQSDLGYQIHSARDENFVLDLAAGSRDNGAKICIWENKSGQNQQWKLEPAQC